MVQMGGSIRVNALKGLFTTIIVSSFVLPLLLNCFLLPLLVIVSLDWGPDSGDTKLVSIKKKIGLQWQSKYRNRTIWIPGQAADEGLKLKEANFVPLDLISTFKYSN